ncbi:MAG: T9SS type A sorting domain-containing protein [Bacteroidota bacterium]|nr:T9SS type A sorting domain-containing protein [Bacteroidota bacterium]
MGKIYLYCKHIPAAFKRIAVSIAFTFCYFFSASGQTTDIGGIVNTYHKVIEIIPSKACVRITNIAALDMNSRVMLVQMKGATINTSNNATYGNVTSLNEAGNYEIGTVCYIIGDSVFLFHDLLNTYNTTTGKVQLIQFGEYYSANVIDTVKAQSWDSTAGTGGVIAIFCDQDLTLTKPIYADSSGYSGGAFLLHGGTCSDGFPANGYVSNPTSVGSLFSGAYKGEGVVGSLTTAQSGGRGAPANAGGGGNNHNNSGGGGANLNGGGRGGGNSSSGVPCTLPFPGEGGKALSSSAGTKIFMGGGGGAGNTNNGASAAFSYGGNGGGIIFIWAVNLVGTGELITARGGNGGNSASDGAGGGGAGGTIILNISNYSGAATTQTDGGSGGTSNNGGNLNRCFGGGGGGSGGAIYFTGAVPAITVTTLAGAAGPEIGRDATCNPTPQSAVAGNAGQIFSSYTFSRSTATAGYCRVLLPVEFIAFNASAINKKVLLDWQIDNPESLKQSIVERAVVANQWTGIMNVIGNDAMRSYSAIDENPLPGRVQYRIKFIDKKNTVSYSPVRQVITGKDNEFVFYPNPARDKIIVAGNLNGLASIRLTDLSGKIIIEKNSVATPATINLPRLPAGIYILRVNQVSRKLIIH